MISSSRQLRRLVRALALMALSAALCALAPAATAAPRVLIVSTRNNGFYNQALDGLRAGLASRGYGDGQIQIACIALTGNENTDTKSVQLQLRQSTELLITLGTDATSAVAQQHPSAPIVFAMVLDPVGLGVVKSLDSPSGNCTGTILLVDPGKQIEALTQSDPSVRRIGVIYTAGDTASAAILDQARNDAKSLGVEIVADAVGGNESTASALSRLNGSIDAVWMIPDPASASPQAIADTLAYASQQGIPVLGSTAGTVKAGALLALTASLSDIGDVTAEMAAQILSGSQTPAQMPVRGPRQTILSINLDTAKSLKVTIPAPMLHLADEVVETKPGGN